MTLIFDKLAYKDKLTASGIPDDAARAHADALQEALQESVATKADITALRTATSADITALRTATSADITALRNELQLVARDLTIRMGGFVTAGVAVLIAVKFFAH